MQYRPVQCMFNLQQNTRWVLIPVVYAQNLVIYGNNNIILRSNSVLKKQQQIFSLFTILTLSYYLLTLPYCEVHNRKRKKKVGCGLSIYQLLIRWRQIWMQAWGLKWLNDWRNQTYCEREKSVISLHVRLSWLKHF